MTVTAQDVLPPGPDGPAEARDVLRSVLEFAGSLQGRPAAPGWETDPAAARAELGDLARARDALTGVLAVCTARFAELGMESPNAVLTWTANLSRAEAARLRKLGARLREDLPATRAGVLSARVSEAQTKVIVRLDDQLATTQRLAGAPPTDTLPPDTPPPDTPVPEVPDPEVRYAALAEARAVAEDHLVGCAAELDPAELRREAEDLRHRIDPDGLDRDHERAHGRRGVTVATTFGGAAKLNGDTDAISAATLNLWFDLHAGKTGPGDARTTAARRHDALLLAVLIALRAQQQITAQPPAPDRAPDPTPEPTPGPGTTPRPAPPDRAHDDVHGRAHDDADGRADDRVHDVDTALAGLLDLLGATARPGGTRDEDPTPRTPAPATTPPGEDPLGGDPPGTTPPGGDRSGTTRPDAPASRRLAFRKTTPAELLITTDRATLVGRPGGPPARLGDGTPIPMRTAQRLACEAALTRILTAGDGQPLNVGRTQRLFTPAQTKALITRDRECRWPGCHVPGPFCVAHHITFWSHGGTTDLANGLLLCPYHHRCVHEHRWRLTLPPPSAGEEPGAVLIAPPATWYLGPAPMLSHPPGTRPAEPRPG